MKHIKQSKGLGRRVSRARIAGAILALGGLSASALGVDAAGASRTVVVSTTKNGKLGTILVSGKTLYTLQPSMVACTAQCLAFWPALVLPKGVTKAKAGKGVKHAKLGSVPLSGGVRQVTYGGKPLYWFAGDRRAGQVHGNLTDTWGKWSVVVIGKPKSSSTGGGTGGVAF